MANRAHCEVRTVVGKAVNAYNIPGLRLLSSWYGLSSYPQSSRIQNVLGRPVGVRHRRAGSRDVGGEAAKYLAEVRLQTCEGDGRSMHSTPAGSIPTASCVASAHWIVGSDADMLKLSRQVSLL